MYKLAGMRTARHPMNHTEIKVEGCLYKDRLTVCI